MVLNFNHINDIPKKDDKCHVLMNDNISTFLEKCASVYCSEFFILPIRQIIKVV